MQDGVREIRLATLQEPPLRTNSGSRKSLIVSATSSRDDFGDETASSENVRLVRDAIYNSFGFLVAGAVGIFLVPFMLHGLGAEAYGLWVATLAVTGIVGAFDFGLGSIITREVAKSLDLPIKDEAIRVVKEAGKLYLLFASAGAVIISALGFFLPGRLNLSPEAWQVARFVFVIGGATFFVDQIILFSTAVLGGLRRFDKINRITIAMVLLRAAGIFALITEGADLIAVMIWLLIVSTLTATVIHTEVVRTEPRYRLQVRPFKPSALRKQVSFGLGSVVTTTINSVIWQLPLILIGIIAGSPSIALFNVAQKIPLMVGAVTGRISVVYFPAASQRLHSRDISSTRELVEDGIRWIMILAVPVCVILSLTAPNVIAVWLGEASAEVVLILRLSTVAVFADAVGAIPLQVLWGRGRLRPLLVVLTFALVANVALCVALLTAIGPAGAAYGLVVTTSIRTIMLLWITAQTCQTRIVTMLRRATRGLFLAIASSGLVVLGLVYISSPNRWVSIVAIQALGILLFGLIFGYRSSQARRMIIKLFSFRNVLWPVWRGNFVTKLKRVHFLRSGWYLALALREMWRDNRERRTAHALRDYEERTDPWGYSTPWGTTHLQTVRKFLDNGQPNHLFKTACEIGCGEGFVTELVVPHCKSLLAVDISDAALDRAKQRCRAAANIRFAKWDLLKDPIPGTYDLLLVMGVLECIHRRADLRAARNKIVQMVSPGGYVLLTVTKEHPITENAWWGRWLVRGSRNLNSFLSKDTALTIRSEAQTDTHLFTLYRKL